MRYFIQDNAAGYSFKARAIQINAQAEGLDAGAMSLSLLKFVGQASLVDDAMLPS